MLYVSHLSFSFAIVAFCIASWCRVWYCVFACFLWRQSECAKTTVGTPLYFSPEICEGRDYNDKSDVWALGCLLFELMALVPPFMAANQIALAKCVR